ncbi:hypothetical protein ACIBAI_07290 [Streptomyces sp. NPDC051041]|uniref:hypothetical protein n=1 Tax=Streptomyces sp. NPDC051041 TaxID=3365640 RepID=UPI00379D5ECD
MHHSRAVLVGFLIAFLGLGAYGAGAQDALDLSRWGAPGTESVRAGERLREDFRTGNPDLALPVTARDGDLDSPRTERVAVCAGGVPVLRCRRPPRRTTGDPSAPRALGSGARTGEWAVSPSPPAGSRNRWRRPRPRARPRW